MSGKCREREGRLRSHSERSVADPAAIAVATLGRDATTGVDGSVQPSRPRRAQTGRWDPNCNGAALPVREGRINGNDRMAFSKTVRRPHDR
jgi:hypothetical protein